MLFYLARRILGNDQDAEDAVQEAFLTIFEKIEKISEIDCPKTRAFLVTIVESKAIDLYRKKARAPKTELLEELQGVWTPAFGEEGLAQCLKRLPRRYRGWLLLRYHQGYGVGEAARLLDLSLDAAYKLDQRARKRLEVLCREEGILE